MSKSSKLKKRLAVATAALTLAVPAIGLAGGTPPTPITPTINPPSADQQTYAFNFSYNTSLALNYAASLLNWTQPLNFLGWTSTPNVPITNQGATSQSGDAGKGTNTQIITTGGGANDMWSGLKNINDHVTLIETSTKPKRASTGNVKIDQAKTEQTEAAKKLLETAKSGNKDEIKKATEELQKKNDELKKVSEKEQNNTPNQEALEKSLKDAQEAAKKVEEARAKAELAARDYLNALKTGDPEIIAAYKERLQEANDAYLAARQNEEAQINNAINPYTIGGVYNNLTGTPEPGQQGGEQQDNSAESGGFPSLSELLRQYQEQQQQQQQSGETTIVTVGEPQESDALKRINDLIGKELIERETNARNKLVKAKTSEERQQAMKELDEIHRLETEKVQKAQAEQNILNLEMKIKEPNWEMDGPRLITEPVRSGEGTQGEPVKPGDYQEWLEQNKDNLSSQQGEQRTSVVETGGQSGLNIGGGETTMTEQKSAEQSAKDAAVKAAQENLDQIRKDAFDKYAALQKAQYDLSAAEDKAEQAANDYLLALKSGDKDTIAAFKEELQKANDALLEAKRNEEAAQQGLKEAGSNIARAQTELNNAQNNFNDSGAADGETQQTTQQAVEQPPYRGLNLEMDGPYLEKAGPITEPMRAGEGTQGEPVKPGDYQEWLEQNKDNLSSQQGEQRTSVVETGGQSGLNIGGGETTMTEQKSAEQSAKDAAVKAAQENLDQIRKDAFDKYAALQKAQYDLSAAEDKAEQAANDYLLALKSGDKDTIAAFKEELQKANDALLEAKRNEEAAQQGLKEAGSNIARAQTELNNAQNNFNDSGAAGGETQQTTQQAVEQPTQQQTVEQPVQQQSGGETAITTQDPLKAKVTELEQKYNDIDKELRKLGKEVDQANVDYTDAKERGASQEELDRLQAKFKELSNEQRRILDERDAAKAELQAAREAAMSPAEKVSKLEQKYNDIDKELRKLGKEVDQANVDYTDAKERGASQEELDRLQAKFKELSNEQRRILDERDAAKAELKAAREAATNPAEKDVNQSSQYYIDTKERGANQEESDSLKEIFDTLSKELGSNLDERDDAKDEPAAVREAANAAEPKQQTVEQPVQQQGGGETTMTEQKSAEQSAKDAAVKAAQENLDQIRKDAFDKYADWQKAQHDLSSAEEKAEKAANDYLLALKSGDKDTIAAFKEELQKANDALLEAKRNEETAKEATYDASSNVARAQAELNNAAK